MTQTQRITNEVCDRHLPPSLEKYLYALENEHEPADEAERWRMNHGQTYVDIDGEWRKGIHIRQKSDIPADLDCHKQDAMKAFYISAGAVAFIGFAIVAWEKIQNFLIWWGLRP